MALATGGRVGRTSGALPTCRHTLSVVAANAANILTVARCAALPVLLVRAGDYHQATLIFLLAAASDDGYIAKRFNAVTTFGTVLDPVADLDSLF